MSEHVELSPEGQAYATGLTWGLEDLACGEHDPDGAEGAVQGEDYAALALEGYRDAAEDTGDPPRETPRVSLSPEGQAYADGLREGLIHLRDGRHYIPPHHLDIRGSYDPLDVTGYLQFVDGYRDAVPDHGDPPKVKRDASRPAAQIHADAPAC